MVSGAISIIVSYIWLVIIVFSPFSLLFCWKKKGDQAGKEHSISVDSVKAVPRPNLHSNAITPPANQRSNSLNHRRTDVNPIMVAGNEKATKSRISKKPTNAELHKHEMAPQRCSNVNHEPSLMATQNSAEQVKQSASLKKDDDNEEQCRSRRRRQCSESKKKGLKQNFVQSVLRKVEAKRNSKESNYTCKPITEATQDESPNSANSSNIKKARRAKRLSRICSVTSNISQNRPASKQSRIACVSTQSDATAGISQVVEQGAIDDGGKEDEEFNNELDTLAGVRSIEREETPSPP